MPTQGDQQQGEKESIETASSMATTTDSVNRLTVVQKPPKADNSRGFLILTVLTASIAITWVPINALWTSLLRVTFEKNLMMVLMNLAATLFVMQLSLDPIFFVLALPDLRVCCREL